MNKITKILFVIVIFLLVSYFFLNGYTNEILDMESKVGEKIGGGELSVKEYYTLAQCIESYKNAIANEEYEKAYNLLGGSYRRFVSYEDYENNISPDDFNEFNVVSIKPITFTTFEVLTTSSGDDGKYLIIVDNEKNRFAIYPDGFLDYVEKEINFSKKKLRCDISSYVLYDDRCIVSTHFENKSKSDVLTISNIKLSSTNRDVSSYNQTIELQPGEIKNIDLEFDASYIFPANISVEWQIKDKDYSYSLEI